MSDAPDARAWERGWEGHKTAQARRLASLTLAEKLAWLEAAHEVVRHLEKRRSPPPGTRPDDGTARGRGGKPRAEAV